MKDNVQNLRGERGIDARVGAGVARDESVSTVDHSFARDGKVAEPVNIVS